MERNDVMKSQILIFMSVTCVIIASVAWGKYGDTEAGLFLMLLAIHIDLAALYFKGQTS
jgi:hypothetical protein